MKPRNILGALILTAALTACTSTAAVTPSPVAATSLSDPAKACAGWQQAATSYLIEGPAYDLDAAQAAMRTAYLDSGDQMAVDMGLAMAGIPNLGGQDEESTRLEILALWAVQNDCANAHHPITYTAPLDGNPGA